MRFSFVTKMFFPACFLCLVSTHARQHLPKARRRQLANCVGTLVTETGLSSARGPQSGFLWRPHKELESTKGVPALSSSYNRAGPICGEKDSPKRFILGAERSGGRASLGAIAGGSRAKVRARNLVEQ
jgi:hypothetical protein